MAVRRGPPAGVSSSCYRSRHRKNATIAERRLVFLDYPEAHREFAAGKLEALVALTGAGDPS